MTCYNNYVGLLWLTLSYLVNYRIDVMSLSFYYISIYPLAGTSQTIITLGKMCKLRHPI